MVLWDAQNYTSFHLAMYHSTYSSTQWTDLQYSYITGNGYCHLIDIGTAAADTTMLNISNTGFTYKGCPVYYPTTGEYLYPGTIYYFAVG